tara:strand:+ start:140140 stop:140385 length:246 start_codon:yes stop_codon:yes gene_type:complete
MDKTITAQWAKEASDKVLGQKVSLEIDKIENAIKAEVGRNGTYISLSFYGEKLTAEEFRNRGFTVTQSDDQRDGSYITIRW